MSPARKRKTPAVVVNPGDLALLGEAGVLPPRDWYRGRIEWSDGEQILVRMWGFGGAGSWLSVLPATHVRAIGDHAALNAFADRCCAEVRDLMEAIQAGEDATARARRAVWTKLEEIGAAGPVKLEVAG